MKKKNKKINSEIRIESIHGDPFDTFDMLNKFGTYEIQPTADTENLFPTIAQGNIRRQTTDNRQRTTDDRQKSIP